MKLLIDIVHPAHVHFFRHAIELLKKDHELVVTARKKEITLRLLDHYGIAYTCLSHQQSGLFRLGLELAFRNLKMLNIARRFKPDLMLGISGVSVSQVALLLGRPAIVFNDTEHQKLENLLTYPFVKKIYTPSCYLGELGPKQEKYAGYHELAYLHPRRFRPDPQVLAEIGLGEQDPFFVVRFVSWKASHDIGQQGFSREGKQQLLAELKKYGRVIITSEAPLEPELEPYRLPVCPTKIHDLLHFAAMYVGEGGTMASEAAVLGTPSVFVNTLTAGTFQELENKYQLMLAFTREGPALSKIRELLQDTDLKKRFRQKREQMLKDKIDVTEWLISRILKYQHN